MNVLDLFSGIGGFSLALERAGMKTIAFCEKDKFCQKVLRKHWSSIPIFEDITKLKGDMINETTNLICGGIPCQPASVAGKRRGTKDDRWLWGETYRIIREVKPEWVLLENVKGLLSLEQGMVFENLLLELESYGYKTETFIIPACAVNAPHRRDRVWIIANSEGIGRKWGDCDKREASGKDKEGMAIESERPDKTFNSLSDTTSKRCNNRPDNRPERYLLRNENRDAPEGESAREGRKCGIGETNTDASNTESRGAMPAKQQGQWNGTKQGDQIITDGKSERLQGSVKANRKQGEESNDKQSHGCNREWDENWIEVATRLCRVDDGVSFELYIIGGIENGKVEGIKTESEISVAIGKVLRYMWEQRKSAKTSQDIYKRGLYNLMPNLPSQSSHKKWNLGSRCEETTELYNLWQRFYSEGLSPSQDLQRNLLECLRKTESSQKKESKQRVDRLKCLGNSVVPQIVEIIGNYIMEAERTI